MEPFVQHAQVDGIATSHQDESVSSRISVVISAYTEARWRDLERAVASLRRQTLRPHQVVVVVDHNPALLARVCEHMPFVVAVENREQRGLSGARNSGISAASGEIIAFLDDDAEADRDWVENIARSYGTDEVIAVGGSVEPHWLNGRPRWFPAEFDWVVGCTYRGMPERCTPVRNVIGANMSFRREVFAEIGAFRSGIGRVGTRPVGCEETELCIRAQRRRPGTVVLYEPSARVRHSVPPERATWRYFRSRCFSEGLSKALVARIAGAGDGLASERTYALRTLPCGFFRGLLDGLLRRQSGGIPRATAIAAGLLITTGGYLVGTTWGLLRRASRQFEAGPEDASHPEPSRAGAWNTSRG